MLQVLYLSFSLTLTALNMAVLLTRNCSQVRLSKRIEKRLMLSFPFCKTLKRSSTDEHSSKAQLFNDNNNKSPTNLNSGVLLCWGRVPLNVHAVINKTSSGCQQVCRRPFISSWGLTARPQPAVRPQLHLLLHEHFTNVSSFTMRIAGPEVEFQTSIDSIRDALWIYSLSKHCKHEYISQSLVSSLLLYSVMSSFSTLWSDHEAGDALGAGLQGDWQVDARDVDDKTLTSEIQDGRRPSQGFIMPSSNRRVTSSWLLIHRPQITRWHHDDITVTKPQKTGGFTLIINILINNFMH